jgi:hypothetical protein
LSLRQALPLAIVAALGAAGLGACGGSSSSGTSTLPKLDVSLSRSNAITSADVDIFAAANATANLLRNPRAAARGRRLLEPLIVARTLRVGAGNAVAGGLIDSISSELDNTVPGLTRQTSKGETLDARSVHSFLVYGQRDPKRVFEPKAAAGAARLDALMRGLPAKAIVNDSSPPQSAGEVASRDARTARAYWPTVAKRLEALQASLR